MYMYCLIIVNCEKLTVDPSKVIALEEAISELP